VLTLVEDDGIRYLSTLGRDVHEFDGAPLDYDTETRTLSLNPAKPQRNAAKAQKRAEEKLKADSAKAGQKRRERNDLIVELLAMMLSEPGIAVNEMRRRAPEGCKGPEVNAAVKLAESWNLCRTEPGPKRSKLYYITSAGEAALENVCPRRSVSQVSQMSELTHRPTGTYGWRVSESESAPLRSKGADSLTAARPTH
jgi:hypothetical protein